MAPGAIQSTLNIGELFDRLDDYLSTIKINLLKMRKKSQTLLMDDKNVRQS